VAEQASLVAAADDVWVPSTCALCYGTCSIRAHRQNGIVVKIEGNPESAVGRGRLCGKGVSGLVSHYDPNRLTVPLRRTNPRKGLDQDPGWREISWEEALGEIAAVLRDLRDDDPRKLLIQRTTTVLAARTPLNAFAAAFGTPNTSTSGGGLHCGNGAHLISGIMHSSWSIVPDFAYCRYAIYFGASKGHGAGHASSSNMRLAADARASGMKMVVVDPMCNYASAKATEWVPVRVGTDGALALAMCNVLVNELGIVDFAYLQAKTNAPYLIGPDKQYVRDPATGKPMVWDASANEGRPFCDVAAESMALEGEYTVAGVRCHPAFHLLATHLRRFTPEWAEEICTVPAVNIRRLSREFGHEARIGSTIVVDGVTLPYRPVAAIAFRGAQGHMNSLYNFLAIDLLNHLVGAADVVGSCLGFNPTCVGHPDTGRPYHVPYADEDGIMKVGMWMGYHLPYPPEDPQKPEKCGLQDLFPMGMCSPFLESDDQEDFWRMFDLPYRPEVLINWGSNLLLAIANSGSVEKALAKLRFIVSFDLFLTETSAFADIVLPDLGYLQQLDSRTSFPFFFCSMPAGMGDWSWTIRQPVLPPNGQQRAFQDVLLELADRLGMRADYNAAFNAALNLTPENRLELDRSYSWDAICDAELKSNFGARHGLDWFKEHGVISWPKKPQEIYWRPFLDVRVPIYWDFLPRLGAQTAAIAGPRGLSIPLEYYEPVPDFLPCLSHCCTQDEFDLYAFYYRDSVHTNSYTMQNAWLDEAARLDPYSYTIAINAGVAARKGLRDGAPVWVETEKGRKVKGRLKLMQGIHPEGLGIAACAGHWADGMPVAKGKGIPYNELLEIDWQHVSPVNLNLDLCVKVKVRAVEAVR
jgi:molybdopterin-containing oxidoreductase family molybdopterin binding subunit